MLTKEEAQKRIDDLDNECSFYYQCHCLLKDDVIYKEHSYYFLNKYEECSHEILGLSVVLIKLNDKEMEK